jgi:hypothetical protein
MENQQITFGQPAEWQAFQKRHPKFIQNLQSLYDILTKVFIREMTSSGHTGPADRVIFYLGRLAVEEFNEVMLLCGNGFGFGGLKILRGLYERVVTLLYIIDNPNKAEAFLDYFHIHMGKFINHAKNLFFLDEFFSTESIAEFERNYEAAKYKYQMDLCKKCGTTKTMRSWSKLDTFSMAIKTKIARLYLPCFFEPTLQVHSTVASLCSRLKSRPDGGFTFISQAQHDKADFSLQCAHNLILIVLDAVNEYFKMGLKEEIEERFRDFQFIWVKEKG